MLDLFLFLAGTGAFGGVALDSEGDKSLRYSSLCLLSSVHSPMLLLKNVRRYTSNGGH